MVDAGSEEVLEQPALGDHIVHVYGDEESLSDSVALYLAMGLRAGEAAAIIARRERSAAFFGALGRRGVDVAACTARGQLRVLDAERTLTRLMHDGMPSRTQFQLVIGGLVAELRVRYSSVRAYGDMVDLLWQRGELDAAIRLEEFWNEIAKLEAFTLLCAYRMDPLDADAYGGALQRVCGVHSHFIAARDARRFNDVVAAATRKVLGWPLSEVLRGASPAPVSGTQMPSGQAALLWMHKHMPLTARKILAEAKAQAR